MPETIECIYIENVLKPVVPLNLSDGERVLVHIERKIPFKPIKLKRPITREEIRICRDESWMPL